MVGTSRRFDVQRHRQLEGQDRSVIPDLPTDDGVERRNVLKSLPSIPTDIYYQSNRIYCVVSIVCCVYHVCRK